MEPSKGVPATTQDSVTEVSLLVLWSLVAVFALHYLVVHVPTWIDKWQHRVALRNASKQVLQAVKDKVDHSAYHEAEDDTKPPQVEQVTDNTGHVPEAEEREAAGSSQGFSLASSVAKTRSTLYGEEKKGELATQPRPRRTDLREHSSESKMPAHRSTAQGMLIQGEQQPPQPQQPLKQQRQQQPSHQVVPSTNLQRQPHRNVTAGPSRKAEHPRPPDEFTRVRQAQDDEFKRAEQQDLLKQQMLAARQAELEQLTARKEVMRQSLVLEPEETDEGAITLSIRIGTQPKERIIRRFLKQHTLRDVAHFVYSHPLLEDIAPEQVKICFGYRSKPVQESSLSQSLEQFGIVSNTVVIAWVDESGSQPNSEQSPAKSTAGK